MEDLDQLFEGSLPSFGGAFLRRTWMLLDEAIGRGRPMTLSIAGPVTACGQLRTFARTAPNLMQSTVFDFYKATRIPQRKSNHHLLEPPNKNHFRSLQQCI